jgi:hypothetical protein
MDDRLLGIYLNDHLAGATAGMELARRCAARNRGSDTGRRLARISGEIEEDREQLRAVMRELGAGENVAKTTLAWIAERTGRLKLNGRLLSYSPLSRVEELEALRIGVEGKLALWRALKETRAADPRLRGIDLDELARRAEGQRDELERMRLEAASEAFGTAPAGRKRR